MIRRVLGWALVCLGSAAAAYAVIRWRVLATLKYGSQEDDGNGGSAVLFVACCTMKWSGGHSSLSFVHNRLGAQLGVHLDQLEFERECVPCGRCTCPTVMDLVEGESTPNKFVQLSAHVEIPSGTTSIDQVNISLHWCDMVASPERIGRGGHDIIMNGHLYTASPPGDENATSAGPSSVGRSVEVTYCFEGLPVNDQVDVKL